jgi:protease stability complex PrcB-like protein
MNLKIVPLIAMVSAVLFVSGCESPQEVMPYQTMQLAEPVDILNRVVGGHPSLKAPELLLITSQRQLDALGADNLIGREIDFYNESVVLATLGEMPSTGFWVNITAVYQEGDLLYVQGQANRPSSDAMAGQMLTFPYCAVVISKTTATGVRDQIESVDDQDPPM